MPSSYAKIKTISIELARCPFWHGHLGLDKSPKLLGRKKPLERLKTVLKYSGTKSGAYLVTGFRGMGKTSLVHEAIRQLNQPDDNNGNLREGTIPHFQSIILSLSYDDVRDLDVLRQIAGQLHRHFETSNFPPQLGDAFRRICELKDHIDAAVTHESIDKFQPSEFKYRREKVKNSRKDSLSYSPALPKEVERILIQIFDQIQVERELVRGTNTPVPEFIFIIDELDKIEPDFVTVQGVRNPEDFAEGLMPGRQRREAIARLLANLKSFLNEVKAKFIFIGGREMYDASLADIADRESFYGSVFHDVIYVESFFKDRLEGNSGVTQMTEAYLCHYLLPDWFLLEQLGGREEKYKDELLKLDTVYKYLLRKLPPAERESERKEQQSALYKTIFQLQNFIVYLTYRSNGTPKKLALLFEQFIVERQKSREISFENSQEPGGEIFFFLYDPNYKAARSHLKNT